MHCRRVERISDLRVNDTVEGWENDLPKERGDRVTQIAADVEDKGEHATNKADEHGVSRPRTRRSLAKLLCERWLVHFSGQHRRRDERSGRMASPGDGNGDVVTVRTLHLSSELFDARGRV